MNLFSFLASLDEQLTAEHGPGLAFLLRPSSPHAKLLLQEHRNPSLQNLARFKGKIAAPWDEIAIHYILVVNNIAKGRADGAFKEQCQLVSLFYRFFVQNGGWTLSALFAILRDLRDLAITADLAKGGSDNMEEAARVISKALGNCMTDRTSPYDSSRKWGIYYIVGMVLKCYFRIKRISLSKNILRALDSNTDRPPLSEYPKGHRVTYRYYLGMIHFLNQEHSQAENELTLAFYECYVDAQTNQERILTYLLPLRMLRGHLPSEELLARFPALHELYSPFILAIKKGDLRTYDATMEKWEARLSDLNLLFTLERARELCMRSLFRRTWIAQGRGNRLKIDDCHAALRVCGIMDVEQEEAECFVANLIFKGFMKGYISHEQQMVVLSKSNPFPRLADRQAPFEFLA